MRFLSILSVAVIGIAVFAACNSREAMNSRTLGASSAPTPADGVRRVTVSELQNMVNKNDVVIVDVRTEDAYNVGHIRGARLIPLSDIEKRSGELPKDRIIVTYCA